MSHIHSLPYGPELPAKSTFSGPKAPDLEYLIFPMGIIDYGHGFPSRGNYGVSVVWQSHDLLCLHSGRAPYVRVAHAPTLQGAILLKPSSAGSVELRTNSVYDAPLIDAK